MQLCSALVTCTFICNFVNMSVFTLMYIFSFVDKTTTDQQIQLRELVLPSLNLNCHVIYVSKHLARSYPWKAVHFSFPELKIEWGRLSHVMVSKLSIHRDDIRLSCCRMDHEETRCRLVVDKRSATSLPPHRRRSSLATRSRYVVLQIRNEWQVSCVTADTSLTGAIIGGGPVVAAAGPAMRRWARRGCCYPSTPDQRWVIFLSTNITLLGNHSFFFSPKVRWFFICVCNDNYKIHSNYLICQLIIILQANQY